MHFRLTPLFCLFFRLTVGHWLVLAYGIIALQYHISLLLYVPLPALFYVITVKFTDPEEFSVDKGRRGN